MRELLPLFLWTALGNHLLLRIALRRGARGWWSEALALLALAGIALHPVVPLVAMPFPASLALVAVAQAIAVADADEPVAGPLWLRHCHAIAALTGGNIALALVTLASDVDAADALRAGVAITALIALIVAAWPAARARMAEAAPLRAPPTWMAPLWIGLLALALSGLAGRLA